MSDPELKELLSQLVVNSREQQERFAEEKAAQAAALLEVQTKLAEERAAADERFAQLIGSIQRPGPVTVQHPDPNPVAVFKRSTLI